MRVADNTITRNYLNNLSSNTEQLYADSTKVSSGKSYQSASEDPADAIKAMKVRSTLAKITAYQGNIDEVSGILSERETAVSELNKITTEAKAKIIQGESGTYNEADRKTIAETLRSYQNTVLSLSNQMYTDKYVFGGVNDYNTPFAVGSDGRLKYQDISVDDPGTFNPEEVYCDIGLGSDGASAYNVSSPGSKLLGTGVSNGTTNNLYNLLGDIADEFSKTDLPDITKYTDKLDTISNNLLVSYTSIGEESSYLTTFSDRLTTSKTNAVTAQSKLENADTAAASVEYSAQETAYQATLQVGAKLIQKTLLDYLS